MQLLQSIQERGYQQFHQAEQSSREALENKIKVSFHENVSLGNICTLNYALQLLL